MSKRTRKQRRMVLAAVAAMTWGFVLVSLVQTIQLAAKAPFAILLTSQPQAVKVRSGRVDMFDGNYVQTPLKIPLSPGRHNLKLSRLGFITHEITVIGSAGQTIPIDHVLEPSPKSRLNSVYVTQASAQGPLYVVLDENLYEGKTPFTLDQLVVGHSYNMTVYPRWPSKDLPFRCRFQVPQNELDISLTQNAKGHIRSQGCRPLR